MAKARSYLQLQNQYMFGQRAKARAASRKSSYKGGKLPKLPKAPKKPCTRNKKGELKLWLRDPSTGAIYKRKPTKGFKKNGMPRAPPSAAQMAARAAFAQRARGRGKGPRSFYNPYQGRALPALPSKPSLFPDDMWDQVHNGIISFS